MATPKTHTYLSEIEYETIGEQVIGVRQSAEKTNGPVILLIHGIGVSSRYFLPLAAKLSETHTVIAIDLPGYGKAPKPVKPLDVTELAFITSAFINKHALNNVVLIGHSMGCQIAAHVSLVVPTSVSKLILISPTVNKDERNVFMQGMRLLQDTFLEPLRVNLIIFSDYIRMGIIRYLRTSHYMVHDHLEKTLTRTSTSTLIIRGQKDHIAPRRWVELLQHLAAESSLVEIPNGPHALHYHYAKQVSKLCEDFIRNS